MNNNLKFDLFDIILKIKQNWWSPSLILSLRALKDLDIKIFNEYKEIYFYPKNNIQEKTLKNIENWLVLKKILNDIWYHKLFINNYNLFYNMLYFYNEWYDGFWFHLESKKHILTWTEYNLEWFFHPDLGYKYKVTEKYWKLNFINWYNIFWFNEMWIHNKNNLWWVLI